MIKELPQLKSGINYDREGLEELIEADMTIEPEDFFMFSISAKKQGNNIELCEDGLNIYNPLFQKFNNQFSVDKDRKFKLFTCVQKDCIEDGFTDVLFGYGTKDDGIKIDGFVQGIDKLHDEGEGLLDGYFTSKRDELYYSEEVFDLQINSLINELILSRNYQSILDLIELKNYIKILKVLLRDKNLHKAPPIQVTTTIREAFNQNVQVNDYVKRNNIDLFTTCAEFLNMVGVIDIIGTVLDDNTTFDYFLDSHIKNNLSFDEYALSIQFNERFIKMLDKSAK